jgi:2-methylaconitate cis-trans-isomerase PrpF
MYESQPAAAISSTGNFYSFLLSIYMLSIYIMSRHHEAMHVNSVVTIAALVDRSTTVSRLNNGSMKTATGLIHPSVEVWPVAARTYR